MDGEQRGSHQQARRLARVLRERREDILSAWERAVRSIPKSKQLERLTLRNEVPDLLSAMADAVEAAVEGREFHEDDTPERHALQRLDIGFDLEEVVTEYAVLRRCIVQLLEGEGLAVEAMHIFSSKLDDFIVQAVSRYHHARERTLKALDRIAEAAANTDMERFLPTLVHVLVETAPAIDVVAIFLREGDRLRIRAAVGLDEEMERGLTIPVNDGSTAEAALRRHGARAVYGVPLLERGEVVGLSCMASYTAYQFSDDDLQLFRAMASRAHGLISLYRVNIALQNSLKERELLLGIVGHDLRNPLAAITTSAEQLERHRALGPSEQRKVARILRSAERINNMIGELLDFARARLGGGLSIEPAPIDLEAVVRSTIEEIHATHPNRTILIEHKGDTSGSWDGSKMTRVISNLLGNAVQHGAADRPITLRLIGEPGDVVLELHNHGNPISADLLPRLFDPFVERARPERAGLGLGLYIVSRIIDAHGGEVAVESTAEQGTTFRIRVPRQQRLPDSRSES